MDKKLLLFALAAMLLCACEPGWWASRIGQHVPGVLPTEVPRPPTPTATASPSMRLVLPPTHVN